MKTLYEYVIVLGLLILLAFDTRSRIENLQR